MPIILYFDTKWTVWRKTEARKNLPTIVCSIKCIEFSAVYIFVSLSFFPSFRFFIRNLDSLLNRLNYNFNHFTFFVCSLVRSSFTFFIMVILFLFLTFYLVFSTDGRTTCIWAICAMQRTEHTKFSLWVGVSMCLCLFVSVYVLSLELNIWSKCQADFINALILNTNK